MSDFVEDRIPADEMIKTSDVAEPVRFLLRLSPTCSNPEVIFQRRGLALAVRRDHSAPESVPSRIRS